MENVQISDKLYSNLPNACGVYMICNLSNDKRYIGYSNNIRQRVKYHYSLLNRNKHYVVEMQHDWNINSYKFIASVLEITKYKEQEVFWIELYGSYKHGYNTLIGRQIPESTKLKMSKAKKGKVKSLETKDKMSKSHKGIVFSEEHLMHLKEARQ